GRVWAAAAAACLCALAIGGVLAWKWMTPDTLRTAAGERRVVTLSDGSQVQLDSLSELQVRYSGQTRALELIKGQARFDVAHETGRPFEVNAASRKVVALGTAFNIDLLGKTLLVTLNAVPSATT